MLAYKHGARRCGGARPCARCASAPGTVRARTVQTLKHFLNNSTKIPYGIRLR